MNYRVLKIYFEINLWCPGSQFRWYESDWSKRDERKSGHLMNSRTLIKCTLCTFIVEQIRALRDILLLAIEPSIFFISNFELWNFTWNKLECNMTPDILPIFILGSGIEFILDFVIVLICILKP